MAFNKDTFSPVGGQSTRGAAPQVFSYLSKTDLRADISADGYFNGGRTYLEKNDIIKCIAVDGYIQLRTTVVPINGDIETEATGDSVFSTPIDGDYTIMPTDQRIEVDASAGDICITLPIITDNFKNKPEILIKRIDEATLPIVRISGTNSNFEEDDYFTPLSQTVSQTGANELTANLDVSGVLKTGDTIQVAGSDVFTISNVATAVITTNETIVTAYSGSTLDVGGYILGDDIILESMNIYASNNNVWRSSNGNVGS